MSRLGRRREPAWNPDIPVLRGLGPEYEEDLHGRHAAVLLQVLTDSSATAARNIALAGHYGSGKSSVLLGVQAGLDEREIGWVNLSLSSLGVDDTQRGRIQDDGTLPPLTNLIQKEIVKQLLYRKAPADMPRSRYLRIDTFRPGPAAMWGAAVAIGFVVITVLLGLVGRVRKTAPQALVKGHPLAPWVIVAGLGVFVGVVWFLSLRVLQTRMRLESLSAGGATVKLTAKENSYFDEYLDEIVYFFQATRTQVAIFEDLDRFKDPHIFETLRELNTVLNNSEQIKSRPIRFVYAVRDSIFERLEVGADDEQADLATLRASVLESGPSANRTKFFDLVIPMVPFITHRSARDLVAAEFAGSEQQLSTALVNLVGAHLTDMRLIRNIRNEFEIYRASVLGAKGLKGLTADRLFAMMVYKNLHLDDFEAIRLGTSTIDDAHKSFRDMVDYQAREQTRNSRTALDRAASAEMWDTHAEAAGRRLQHVLPVLTRSIGRSGEPTIRYQAQNFAQSDLTSTNFWRSLYETRENVRVTWSGYAAITLSFADVTAMVGPTADALDDAVGADVAALRRASRAALETKEFVAKATMAEVMARIDLTMPTDGGDKRNLDGLVADLVSPLARELLAKGYIDENYTLYCSDYHAVAISVSAMNFILHCVQADRADPRFRFDEPASIEAVEAETGERFLDGESVFNVEVFDHYLRMAPERLDKALAKLAVRVGSDPSFVDAYLVDGDAAELLVHRLAPRWSGVFVHLVENAPLDRATVVTLVDAAAGYADRAVDYESSTAVAEFLSQRYAEMQIFVGSVDQQQAEDLADLLRRLSVQIPDLSTLGEAQRAAVVAAGLYPVTRTNLLTAVRPGVGLALDVVRTENATVYERLLENTDDYLQALDPGEATVEAADEFVTVLSDVVNISEAAVLRIAERASDACAVAALDEVDERAWPAVVASGRFAPTVRNVSLFVEKLGITSELAAELEKLDLVHADAVSQEPRLDLAHALVEATNVSVASRVRLLSQLDLSTALALDRLADAGLALIPDLLASGLVPDSADTYAYVSDRDLGFRERYFAASPNLSAYVCELPLSGDDLNSLMRSRRVSPAAKRAVADDVEFVRDRLSGQAASAICDWAMLGNTVSDDLLAGLAEAGANAEQVLGLLEPALPTIDLALLDRLLLALGDEYEPLTRSGRHRPKLKDRDGTRALLEELQRRGRVSSFTPAIFGGYRVNMRVTS
jgi:hypothetical protein